MVSARAVASRAATCTLALLLAAATVAHAQADPPRATESMEVVLIDVEVWVQDRDGDAIRGLSAADFEVLEDGERVPITHFAEVRGAAAAPTTEPAPASPAGEGFTAVEEPGYLVVYFDQLHLTVATTRRLVTDLRAFLAAGPVPAERILILRQAHELYTEATFGSTAEQLDSALERIAKSQSLGDIDPRLVLTRLQSEWDRARELPSPCRTFAIAARAQIAVRVAEQERSAGVTLAGLRTTARLLSGVSGPKTLLFVSDSLATRPGVELVRFAQSVCPANPELTELGFASESHLVPALREFAQEANRNRVTVYPFQATGLQTPAGMGAEQRGIEVYHTGGVEALQRAGAREGLLSLARETGGWAIVDRNKFGAELARLREEMSSYYSLAYPPRQPGGTGLHTIEVRLVGERARGARLRHRLGYRDKGAEDLLQELLEGAVAFGVMRNPLGVRIAAGVLGEGEEGRYALPLHVFLPVAGVAFLPGADGDRASLELAVHAGDARSGEAVRLRERYDLPRPGAGAEHVGLKVTLRLPQGVHVVAVAVRDVATGEHAVVATTVAIHDPQQAGVAGGANGSR